MKTKLITAFVLISGITMAQIPNNGFENWTNQGTYNTPDSWGNLNQYTSTASIYTCTKGTPGSVGASYIKLTSKTVTGLGVVPGVAVSGTIDTNTFNAVSGFPYTGQPVSLKGKWQHMAYSGDEGFIAVYLTKWNTTGNNRDTVAKAVQNLGAMVMSWANFTINLNYLSTASPDSAIIVLSSSRANGVAAVNNSYLYVDELTFFGTTGIDENIAGLNKIKISPNPSHNFLNLAYESTENENVSIALVDITGKKVKEINNIVCNTGKNTIRIETSDIVEGIYFLTLTNNKGSKTEKLIIQ